MAVHAHYGGGGMGMAGVVVPQAMCLPRGLEVDLAVEAQEFGGMFCGVGGYAAGGYDCAAAVVSGAAQSELTCNNGGSGGGVVMSRKREREMVEQYVASSAALLPIPGMTKAAAVAPVCRVVESAMTSTSGRPAAAVGDALVTELCLQSAEIDAVVRMECERMSAGLEQARKRQCQALVRAASASVARRLREKEAELEAARRRAAELEERLRQAAAESQAWCGLARSNEAVAAGLRATLDHLLRAAPAPAAEGFGDSGPLAAAAAADDAQSCCFETTNPHGATAPGDDAATSPAAGGKWSCKSCSERDATVLLLPCRHLCLCKACEPRLDACPVCLAPKNASVHIATN
ncbi:E3 ubiquitin-protein ligase BOI-like [Oryza brachyantha]|uniref:E3 ubiquitin-protein ligase BOI-like n=1 Tax=Oryza brachyantha TaxID=4533 RepID=UPI001AD99280|nr:E3 ubiquitin-protein ligase BOI-like [Oryza brachyantha]